jgi:isopenicillin N synthase-like dioxygenase
MADIPPAFGAPELDPDGEIPVLDLEAAAGPGHGHAAVASAYARGGFVVVTGHGVAWSTVERLDERARAFFARPGPEKTAVAKDPLDPFMHGYDQRATLELYSMTLSGESATASSTRDGAGRAGPTTANRWPAVPGFRQAFLDYHTEVERLARRLIGLCALALGLPRGWFDDRFDRHTSLLTVNYYPPRDRTGVGDEVVPRNEAHRDFSALTVLYQDEGVGGLEVLDHSGRWREVPRVPGSLVVNLGDLMARWTNDRWSSTLHRVVAPTAELAERDRVSVAFFYLPNADAVVECVPTCVAPDRPAGYAPITAGEYFAARARRAYLTRLRQRDSARA